MDKEDKKGPSWCPKFLGYEPTRRIGLGARVGLYLNKAEGIGVQSRGSNRGEKKTCPRRIITPSDNIPTRRRYFRRGLATPGGSLWG